MVKKIKYRVTLIVIVFGCILFYFIRINLPEQQKYLILEIPRIDPSISGENRFSDTEEYSSLVWNSSDHKYFIWRMELFDNMEFNEEGIDTLESVVGYYNDWMIKSGWEEAHESVCNLYKEYRPGGIYHAYFLPTKYYDKPVACLTVWLDIEGFSWVNVLIKTVNPSKNNMED